MSFFSDYGDIYDNIGTTSITNELAFKTQTIEGFLKDVTKCYLKKN